MVVVAVNYSDEFFSDIETFDLVLHGIAVTVKDNCYSINLMTGEKTYHKGGDSKEFKDLQPHSSLIYKIQCSPF